MHTISPAFNLLPKLGCTPPCNLQYVIPNSASLEVALTSLEIKLCSVSREELLVVVVCH